MNGSLASNTLASTVQIGAGMLTESNGAITIDWIRARNYAAIDASALPGLEQHNHNSGIDEQLNIENINIYPNPAHDMINIDMRGSGINLERLEMIDMNGRTIQSINMSGYKENIEIPAVNLTKGIYLIRLIGGKGTVVQKISVE